MNEFSEFLYRLRKEKGMTQAELADRLGITNKAVSKWETGEAMPDTALLVPLAENLGVTVDELLKGARAEAPAEEAKPRSEKSEPTVVPIVVSVETRQSAPAEDSKPQTEEPKHRHAADHILTHGRGDDDEPPTNRMDKIGGAVSACIVLVGVIVYVIVSTVVELWHPLWLIPACCGIGSGICGIIFDMTNRERCEWKLAHGDNPYSGGACGLIMLVCTIAYLISATLSELWHPLWIIPAAGGVTCAIVGTVGALFVKKGKNK